jgi:hypothetical protein
MSVMQKENALVPIRTEGTRAIINSCGATQLDAYCVLSCIPSYAGF